MKKRGVGLGFLHPEKRTFQKEQPEGFVLFFTSLL
jgi:hypothetical protein